jgi:hypothetical protein
MGAGGMGTGGVGTDATGGMGTGGIGTDLGGTTGTAGAGVGGMGLGGRGVGGIPGTGGSGAGGNIPCSVVSIQDFETSANPGNWFVDNSSAQAGTKASHPPILPAGGSASMTFSCGGTSHSQLKFWYRGLAPSVDQQLSLFVDDVLYRVYGSTPNGVGGYPYYEVDLTLPDKPHNYRWEASTNSAGQPPFWVDSISCVGGGTSPNVSSQFDFEDCFVPPEVGGTFQIDNSSRQSGTYAAHPPSLPASGSASLTFSCGDKPHSQLVFEYQGINPLATQRLTLFVDENLYQVYGATPNGVGGYPFYEVALVVPTGLHAYRWEVSTTTAGQPPFWIDSIRCLNFPVGANTSSQFGFEEGFVPPEIGGTFLIDNSSAQAGTFGAHPPILPANGTASLTFSCGGKAHSQLVFDYRGVNPPATQRLNFFVDNNLYQAYGSTPNGVGGYPFFEVAIVVPLGSHAYRWETMTPSAGQPPFWIDSIRCQ